MMPGGNFLHCLRSLSMGGIKNHRMEEKTVFSRNYSLLKKHIFNEEQGRVSVFEDSFEPWRHRFHRFQNR
jgi:hypothetical protein